VKRCTCGSEEVRITSRHDGPRNRRGTVIQCVWCSKDRTEDEGACTPFSFSAREDEFTILFKDRYSIALSTIRDYVMPMRLFRDCKIERCPWGCGEERPVRPSQSHDPWKGHEEVCPMVPKEES